MGEPELANISIVIIYGHQILALGGGRLRDAVRPNEPRSDLCTHRRSALAIVPQNFNRFVC